MNIILSFDNGYGRATQQRDRTKCETHHRFFLCAILIFFVFCLAEGCCATSALFHATKGASDRHAKTHITCTKREISCGPRVVPVLPYNKVCGSSAMMCVSSTIQYCGSSTIKNKDCGSSTMTQQRLWLQHYDK